MNAQISQYSSGAFCTNHPLLHTLYIGFFHDLFNNKTYGYNINKGYFLAGIIQLLLVDGAMTYGISYTYATLKKKYGLLCMIAFYALFPVCSLLAISHTKDIAFSTFAFIFFIDSSRVFSQKTIHYRSFFYIRMVLNCILMILLRANAIYAIIPALLILLIMYLKAYRSSNSITRKDVLLRYILILLCSVIVAELCSHALIRITNATPGSIKEMMSIPAQIDGRIYNTVASEEEKTVILEYIPNADEYKYYISDPMKLNLPFEIWESKCRHFLLDSTILAIHHPVIAIQAVILNIQGYFDPIHMPYSLEHFYLARYDYRGDATLDSRIPYICDLYVSCFRTTDRFSHNPIIVALHLALYIWITIIGFIISLICSKREPSNTPIKHLNCIAYIFPLLYLCTLLLGPAAIMRYGYLYILIAPIVIVDTVSHIKNK